MIAGLSGELVEVVDEDELELDDDVEFEVTVMVCSYTST